ncbi:MAG: hypothetical protein AAGH60_10725 [Pseudomonadota bacterium]
MDTYLSLDDERQYALTPCLTLDQALSIMGQETFDALIIDNRMPPYESYHEPHRKLLESTGFDGPTIVISADIEVPSLGRENRNGDELVIDKADLSYRIREGVLASLVA